MVHERQRQPVGKIHSNLCRFVCVSNILSVFSLFCRSFLFYRCFRSSASTEIWPSSTLQIRVISPQSLALSRNQTRSIPFVRLLAVFYRNAVCNWFQRVTCWKCFNNCRRHRPCIYSGFIDDISQRLTFLMAIRLETSISNVWRLCLDISADRGNTTAQKCDQRIR